jgi:hypothetical protein
MQTAADQLNVKNVELGLLFPDVKNPKVYQCPAETKIYKNGAQSGPLVRNYSIAGQMGADYVGVNYEKPIQKETDIVHPAPSHALVFLHESIVTIDDGDFVIDVKEREWQNIPSTIHLKGDNLSFADGHEEHWTWYERNTLNLDTFNQLALSPTDRDFARMAAAYSTPLSGGGQY